MPKKMVRTSSRRPPRQLVKAVFSELGPFTPEPQDSPETRGTSVSTARAGVGAR
jgi:hypothetical protein